MKSNLLLNIWMFNLYFLNFLTMCIHIGSELVNLTNKLDYFMKYSFLCFNQQLSLGFELSFRSDFM